MEIDSHRPERIQKKCYFDIEESGYFTIPISKANNPLKKKIEFRIDNCREYHTYQIFCILNDAISSPYKSEMVLSTSNFINFKTALIYDYFPEKEQKLYIDLKKDSAPLGHVEIALTKIVSSPTSSYNIGDGVSITVLALNISDDQSIAEVDFKVENLNNVDFYEPENYFSYSIFNKEKAIYRSESISFGGKFDKARIPISLLQNGFTVKFLNSMQETIKEENYSNFNDLKNNFYLKLENPKGKLFYIYNRSKVTKKYNFLDYLRKGVTIELTIGIDYSFSNKFPNYRVDYEKAINACGNIVANDINNERFSVYGFGARIKGQNVVNDCFNINFKNNPEIEKIDNVIKEYHNSFQNLEQGTHTFFCPLINKVIENIKKENDPKKYNILLILTVGIINDMKKTIDVLVEASFHPLSIIIIGIGNGNFQDMKELDKPLISFKHLQSLRDIVQFVHFNEYKNDENAPNKLPEEVLQKVTGQATKYYTMHHIEPDDL